LAEAVPGAPTVPTEIDKRQRCAKPEGAGAALAEWEERAAIIEFDGGMSRAEAERRATEELGL